MHRITAIAVLAFLVHLTITVYSQLERSGDFNELIDSNMMISNQDLLPTTLRSELSAERSIVLFWASWCHYCKDQVDYIISAQEANKPCTEELKVLLVNVD